MKGFQRWVSIMLLVVLVGVGIFTSFQVASADSPVLFSENFNSFTGSGFAPTPSLGQLDSDVWIVTGMSDGSLAWGGTGTSGDFARGQTSGHPTTGGVYAFGVGTGNYILGVQPVGEDFTPGTIQLRVQNTTGYVVDAVEISYEIWTYNDQGRANSLNLAYSTDGTNWQLVSALDYVTPAAADSTRTWVAVDRSTIISGLNIANNSYVYFRWSGDDVSGSGSRDEYGIDDVQVVWATPNTITLDGSVTAAEWGSGLGTVNSTQFGVTWDDDFWYFSVQGGFSTANDYLVIGIDTDPLDETTNTGETATFCGANFPGENKPNYVLQLRQGSGSNYLREGFQGSGSGWSSVGGNYNGGGFGATDWQNSANFDFSGSTDYEVKLSKALIGLDSADPVGIYLYLCNSSGEVFNAWPPENHNGWTGSAQFLFAHTRFATTDAGRLPAEYGSRVAWAANNLSANSTIYNFFGGDDISAGNPWLRMTTTASGAGGASCQVRAKLVATRAMQKETFTGINRYVDFTLTNCTNLEVDVQMRYEEAELNGVSEASTTFYRCASAPCTGSWSAVSAGDYTRDATNNNLSLATVPQTQFSFWTVSDSNTPTALTLNTLTARSANVPALLALAAITLFAGGGALWLRRPTR